MMSLHRLLPIVALVLVVGCRREDRPAPTKAAAIPKLASSTQLDLARELDAAEPHGTWSEVRRRWQGQHVRWTVTRYKALCPSAEQCNVGAFPIQRPATHGWMPTLAFAPGQFEALAATCGDRVQCEFTFDGTLVELDATGEGATHMRFGDVKLI